MSFVLRDYQNELIHQTRVAMKSWRSVILTSPTGSGKTVLTAHMMRTAKAKNFSAWFLVHRRELLDQTSGALWQSDVPHGVLSAGHTQTMQGQG